MNEARPGLAEPGRAEDKPPTKGLGQVQHILGDWTKAAACNGRDPDLWFPKRWQSAAPAIAICRRCPVIKDCDKAIHALPRHSRYGVWAGVYYPWTKP